MSVRYLMLTATLIAANGSLQAADDHRAEVEAWQQARSERLIQPYNWLSLTGLHWLGDGEQTVGRAPDNAIQVASGPDHLGTITIQGDHAQLMLAAGVQGAVSGQPIPPGGGAVMNTQVADPTIVQVGDVQFMVRDHGRYALRIRDAQAETRLRFAGLEYFDIDPAWRFNARWEAYDPPREIELVTVAGTEDRMRNPGAVVFEHEGQSFRLDALQDNDDDDLFLIVADRTNGRETYGMARYLYSKPASNGRVMVDFNRLFNPPCAFTPYATCALPPEQNRLDLAIRAGEKRYSGMK